MAVRTLEPHAERGVNELNDANTNHLMRAHRVPHGWLRA
jgi:hypothetical protein